MPYASRAQARLFHADPRLRRYAPEFDAATDFSRLPERTPVNGLLSMLGQGGGPSDSISVNPGQHPDAGGGGGDPVASLKAALADIHAFVESADDEQDRQIALQCYAKLQSILATEQKEKEQALGVTPQVKHLAKATARGGY